MTRARTGGPKAFKPARFDQVLWTNVGLGLGIVGGLAVVLVALFVQPEIRVRGGTYRSDAERELRSVLHELKAAWDPDTRARILEDAQNHAARFAGPLGRVLRQVDTGLLAPAVEYAGALGVAALRPYVEDLVAVRTRGVPERAVRAAENLAPWSDDDLAALLTESITPVQIEALGIVGERAHGPWIEVLALLRSDDPAVRDAAVHAIPRSAPDEVVATLRSSVLLGEPDEVALALRALSRTDRVAALEREVATMLAAWDSELQLAGLDCLAGKGEPLAVREPVWALVVGPDIDQLVRARALYCLEQTDSIDVERVRMLATSTVDPLPRYFAARCLVAAGEPAAGTDLLIDLLRGDDAAAEDADREAESASRRLLAWLCGISPGCDAEQFRATLARAPRIPGRRLPAPGIAF